MQGKRRLIVATSVLILAMVMLFVAGAQENKERLASSDGQGTLRVGDENFKLNAVIVKLIQHQKVEVILVADITIFLTGTWSNHAESPHEIDLQFSGSEARGGFEGVGKVTLGNEGKSVPRLTLKGVSRATKRPVEANFEGK